MEPQINNRPTEKKIKLDFKDGKYATGRRKKSIARVWLKKGSGSIYINGKKMVDYFKKPNLQIAVCRPFALTKRDNDYNDGKAYWDLLSNEGLEVAAGMYLYHVQSKINNKSKVGKFAIIK